MKTEQFTVNIELEGEKEPLRGVFKVKTKLSMQDIMAMDNLRRQFLGSNGGEADGLAFVIARDLAEIQVHTLSAPSWWTDAKNGLELDDVKVVFDVYDALQAVKKSNYGSLTKKAEEAKAELKEEKEEK